MAPPKKLTINEIRRALYRWLVWSPLLAVFAVIAKDTLLGITIRHTDYDFGRLVSQRRHLTAELDKAKFEQAMWTNVSRVTEIIKQFNMVFPDPQQIQNVIAHPDTPMPGTGERAPNGGLELAATGPAPIGRTPTPSVSIVSAVAVPVIKSTPPPAPTVSASMNPPAPTVVPAVAVASLSGGNTAVKPTVLDLPKEQITDLDPPDTPSKDLRPRL